MNIYQNGEFSKNLHKLTKYQSLAATVNDQSKQSLYSQKIKEYRNKLDKVGSVQTGGTEYDRLKSEISSKINSLVSKDYQTAFNNLKAAHDGLMRQIDAIGNAVNGILLARNRSMTELENAKTKLTQDLENALEKLSETNTEAGNLKVALAAKGAEIKGLRKQLVVKPGDPALKTQFDQLQAQLAELQRKGMQIVPDVYLNGQALEILRGELTQRNQELAAAKALLAERGNTGNQECDQQIASILQTIDSELTGRVNEKPDNSFNYEKLTTAAQEVLARLTTQTTTM